MTTVIFYISILLVSTFFVYISDKGKGRLEYNLFMTIAFLIVFIPSALRYDVGTDYVNYVDIYNNIKYYTEIEPAYYFINLALSKVNSNQQWVFIVSAFIFTITIFKTYPKKYAWVLHFVIIALLWFYSLNVTRQAIATAFCLSATFKFFDKKYKQFYILSIVGILFHFSTVLFLIVGTLSLIPISKTLKIKIIPSIFLGVIAFSFLSVSIVLANIEIILNIVGFSKYIGYFGGEYFINPERGMGLGILLQISICTYVFINAKIFIEFNKQYWLLIMLAFMYSISVILSNEILIFGRLQIVFTVAPIVIAYTLFIIPGNRQIHKLVAIIFILFSFYMFVNKSIVSINDKEAKLVPYKSIFSSIR